MSLIEEIGILVGILTAIVSGIHFALKNIKENKEKIRKKIDGKWINAGEASMDNSETHNLELELVVDLEDGSFTGILKSIKIDQSSISPLCSLSGTIKSKSAKVKIEHFQHGEVVLFGNAVITLNKKDLIWNLHNGISDFFPIRTNLFKKLE